MSENVQTQEVNDINDNTVIQIQDNNQDHDMWDVNDTNQYQSTNTDEVMQDIQDNFASIQKQSEDNNINSIEKDIDYSPNNQCIVKTQTKDDNLSIRTSYMNDKNEIND